MLVDYTGNQPPATAQEASRRNAFAYEALFWKKETGPGGFGKDVTHLLERGKPASALWAASFTVTRGHALRNVRMRTPSGA